MIFNIIQLLGGIILSVGYIPQIVQIVKTKDASGLNLQTFRSVALGLALMEIYAINLALEGAGFMFLVTNTLGLVLTSILAFLIHKYQKKTVKDRDVAKSPRGKRRVYLAK